jgi:hypothetical protein
MSYGNKSLEHCQTTDKANSDFGTNGLHGTPDVLLASKLQDGGASQKGAKQPNEQQP